MDDTGFATGKALREAGRFAEAVAVLEDVLADQPGNLDARRWLAGSLLAQGNSAVRDRPCEAERCYRQAIRTWPGFFEAISNLGEALVEQLRMPEALTMFRTALTLRPNDANSGFAYAVALLLSGDLADGWQHFEARRAMAAWHYDRRHELPQWREGTPVQGRHLLLMSEQGIGDVIQFSRYAPLLAGSGIDVTLEVPPALLPLFARMPGPRAVITPDEAADGCDLACPLMSLPLLCGSNLDSIPPVLPQLCVPPERIAAWRDWLGPCQDRRIGLVCSGDPRNPKDATRSVPLAALAPLFVVPGCRFVLLQPELRESDFAAADATPGLLQPRGLLRDFADTAAIISQLDLVIAADTGVAHLAATLGRPVWLLLPHRPDWRWMLNRRDSPWYPTMRLYRQPSPGAWDDVAAAVRNDLIAFCATTVQRTEAGATHYNSACLLLARGEHNEAARAFRQATTLQPESAEAWLGLGNALLASDQPAEAEESYRAAVVLRPDYVEAWNNLGNALRAQHRPADAAEAYHAALACRSDSPEVWLGLGNAMLDAGDPSESERCFREALNLRPDFSDAAANLGNTLVAQHRMNEAFAAYRTALELDPTSAGNRYSYALALLLDGQFEEGWRQHEARRQLDRMLINYTRRRELPQWHRGIALEGRRVLVMQEQGFGDVVQFVRYAAMLAARGAYVVVELPPELQPVFASLPGIARIIGPEDPAGDCDIACPLLSLPLYFATTRGNIPADVPYGFVRPDRLDIWRTWLGPRRGRRIGLACSGRPMRPHDPRHMPLDQLSPLFDAPDCEFYLLQRDVRDDDAAALARIPDLRWPGPKLRDFADTAALLAEMDLVLTVDTALAHLAGALGRPTCVMLPFVPDYRWLLHRRDSPWYPGMTLYRQPRQGDWETVIDTVRCDLALG